MRRKILIIESDAKDRNAMTDILSIIGFKNVISVETGKEGIEKAKSENPAIVIIAFALTDLKGFDVCNEIKSLKEVTTKVILITGKLNAIEPQWEKNSNADAFIVKSSTYESLILTVSKLIKGYQ